MADVNIEEIVIGFIDANKSTGWFVYGDMPKTRPTGFVLVDRTGGPREYIVQDRAEIVVEVYHKTSRESASDEANRIADILKNLESLEPVMRAKVTSLVKLDDLLGQYWRYQIYCDVFYRRDVSTDGIIYPVIPSSGVISVNSKIGAVVIAAGNDIEVDNSGATIVISSTKVSDVQSVNGETGVVVLDADDIDDSSTTNKFTTASDISKLAGIEAGADVTDATNVNAAGATMNTDTSLVGNGYFLDEDNMASNDATKVPSQQSVKAYVDANMGAVDSVNGQTGIVVLDTDDVSEGATNLYSQWIRQTGYIRPKTTTDNLYIGTATTPTAPFSDELGVFESDATAFYDVIAHGDSAYFIGIPTQGTTVAPTATLAGQFASFTMAGYGDSGYTPGTLPGLYITASDTWTDSTAPVQIALGDQVTGFPLYINMGTADNADLYIATQGGQVLHSDYSADRLYFGNADQAFFSDIGELTVPDEAYGAGWNGDLTVPTKNAIYDKISTLAITDITGITASAAEINVLDGIPAGLTATELGYLDGVTSSIQTQFGTKATGPASSTDNAIARFDGTTGKVIQNSTATLDDTGNMIVSSVVVNGSTAGQAGVVNAFGRAGMVVYNTAGDSGIAFGFLPVGLMSFLGYPSAGMVSSAGGAGAVDTALVRSAAGEWTAYGGSGSVLGNIVTERIRYRAGSPESNITAPVGAISHDTTNGAIYHKASGTGNTGWVSLLNRYSSPHQLMYISGGYFDNGYNATAKTTVAGVADRIVLAPFTPPKNITVDLWAIDVTTGVASATARMCVYDSDGSDGSPSTKLLDSTEKDCSGTGVQTEAVSYTFLAGHLYWVGVHNSSTATLRGIPAAGTRQLSVPSGVSASAYNAYFASVAYGTDSPSTFSGSLGTVTIPQVKFRIA